MDTGNTIAKEGAYSRFHSAMTYYPLLLLFLTISNSTFCQNPIVPAGVYLADPSAHVWQDGKLYVYGSLDESTEYYCSYDYHVLSTSDLLHWDMEENVFASRGENDEVLYSDKELYAPDCQFKNGLYYLYYCQPDRKAAEGVATSKSPIGPFSSGAPIALGGIEEIDPAVFIDDDGQAYYIWGQFDAKIARLKPNMTEIDSLSIVPELATEKEHFFHEGAFMFKRNGIYYLVYSDISRGNQPTCIGYSTSDSPWGPFKYGGVIVDNDNCDPSTWNNHGSVVKFKGQWYVFYHRSTHNSRMMRKACVEPITFNMDGSINEVEMTSQGAGPPLKSLDKIEAERACLLLGNSRIELFETMNEKLGGIQNGDKVAYKYIDFKDGADQIQFRVKALQNGGKISVRIDQPWGPEVGVLNISGDESGDWDTVTSKMKKVEGVHAVWLAFSGDKNELFELDWFEFANNSENE
ncbi:family 43 glycosylhydrolase [Mangrovibacterium diazotrophicum]|uniref:Carbohydrate binding protein with CBM6 domain n=1 Tax=Mangrovibacterium diazotrophicum TaxID=1261403 RepID=A0A419W611_9BACT|nr:family 43 glycosylhydrolase [Mangrovibacterium diazotrophicum]RKD90885.1 carbohydrate binding protein with CBM6 domain [Mangrovibacterium diazotrophicum]